MRNILHTADWHIGDGDNTKRIVQLAEHWRRHVSPEEYVICPAGDLMDTPNEDNAEIVAGIIEMLVSEGFVVLPVPGNHDIVEMGVDLGMGMDPGRQLWLDYIDTVSSWWGEWPRVFQTEGGVYIIGVDTNQGVDDDWDIDFAMGALGKTQQMDLGLAVADTPCVVVGHHDPNETDLTLRLQDAGELHHILRDRAWGYLGAHTHRRYRLVRDDVHYLIPHMAAALQEGRLAYELVELVEGLPSRLCGLG